MDIEFCCFDENYQFELANNLLTQFWTISMIKLD